MTSRLSGVTLATAVVIGLMGSSAAYAADKVGLNLDDRGWYRQIYEGVEIVPAFEKENPGITVEATNLSWTSYSQKILTGVAAGEGPDVLSFYSVDVALGGPRRARRPDGKVDPGLFLPTAIANGEWNGKVYALPIGLRMRPLYYRADFLKEAGLTSLPRPGRNFAAMQRS